MKRVDNAVIMAAGVSSRFAPLSYEKPKALTEVKGEVLIERQIRQLQDAGIRDVYVVVGYKAEQFTYLCEKFGVQLILNDEYTTRNNHASIYAAKAVIRNTFICSADNYFEENPFTLFVEESYYAALFAEGRTNEWCMTVDSGEYITDVQIGGKNSWYMLGHAFWTEEFSRRFLHYLEQEYNLEQTRNLFWENIFIKHLDELKMKIRKYPKGYIAEFDSIEELRKFDTSYIADTRSSILKNIAKSMNGTEAEIVRIETIKSDMTTVQGIRFLFRGEQYSFFYGDVLPRRMYK